VGIVQVLFQSLFCFIIIWLYRPIRALASPFGVSIITFLGVDLLVQHPTPNLEEQASVFMTPGDMVVQLYPRHSTSILVVFYDIHGLQWDYSLILVTTRGYCLTKLLYMKFRLVFWDVLPCKIIID
jgi:hypothetical protein